MPMTRLALLFLLAGCFEHGSGGGGLPDGGGTGRSCGGLAGAACGSDELCDFGRNTCGASDEGGTCRKKPSGCTENFDPVCGCDGQTHSNECEANVAGVDVSANGNCPVPSGEFQCGFRTCRIADEYCQRGVSDVGNEPDSFVCRPRPGTCGATTTCSCLATEPCGSFCTSTPGGGFALTCPGG